MLFGFVRFKISFLMFVHCSWQLDSWPYQFYIGASWVFLHVPLPFLYRWCFQTPRYWSGDFNFEVRCYFLPSLGQTWESGFLSRQIFRIWCICHKIFKRVERFGWREYTWQLLPKHKQMFGFGRTQTGSILCLPQSHLTSILR